MELDVINQDILDGSITNNAYSNANALNVPVKRGTLLNARTVIAPYYSNVVGISGANLAIKNNATLIIPTVVATTTATSPTSNTHQVTLPPTTTPTTTTVNTGTWGSHTPFNPVNAIQAIANPTPTQNTTTNTAPTNTNTAPTTQNQPAPTSVGQGGNIPTTGGDVPMGGGMPIGGGGGGGEAPSQDTATAPTDTSAGKREGLGEKRTSMSNGAKFTLLALVVIGGYYAYKNGLFKDLVKK